MTQKKRKTTYSPKRPKRFYQQPVFWLLLLLICVFTAAGLKKQTYASKIKLLPMEAEVEKKETEIDEKLEFEDSSNEEDEDETEELNEEEIKEDTASETTNTQEEEAEKSEAEKPSVNINRPTEKPNAAPQTGGSTQSPAVTQPKPEKNPQPNTQDSSSKPSKPGPSKPGNEKPVAPVLPSTPPDTSDSGSGKPDDSTKPDQDSTDPGTTDSTDQGQNTPPAESDSTNEENHGETD